MDNANAGTAEPAELLEYYTKQGALKWARFHYETWRKTTSMINPPPAWDDLDIRMRVALCACLSKHPRSHRHLG